MSTQEDQEEIQSDKWEEMSTTQLDRQRTLVGRRLQAINDVMASGMVNPTTIGLKSALEYALDRVNNIINRKLT